MLFNSIEFLFLFLPITFVVVWMARRWAGASAALALLTIASVVFYSVLKPWNLPVLLGSVAFNWVMARGIDRSRDRVGVMRRWLMLGIIGNLGLLFWFKYSVFVATQVGLVGEGAPGGAGACAADGATAGHLVLHLSADRVPGGPLQGRVRAGAVPAAPVAGELLSAPHRGPHHAPAELSPTAARRAV